MDRSPFGGGASHLATISIVLVTDVGPVGCTNQSEDHGNESGARCMMGEQARAEHRAGLDEKPIMEI